MDLLYFFWFVLAVEHGIWAKNVFLKLVSLKNSSHLLHLVVFLLAKSKLVLEKGIDSPHALLGQMNSRLESAFLHLVGLHLFHEVFKFPAHLSSIIVAYSGSVLLVLLTKA